MSDDQWYKVRCPNARQGQPKLPCATAIKFPRGIQRNITEMIQCPSCGAQCFVSFNGDGGCHVFVAPKRKKIPAADYPIVAKGRYIRERK